MKTMVIGVLLAFATVALADEKEERLQQRFQDCVYDYQQRVQDDTINNGGQSSSSTLQKEARCYELKREWLKYKKSTKKAKPTK